MSALIQLKKVVKSYTQPAEWFLDELSLNVHEGEIYSIVGPSGCGKTTVLRLVAGFEAVDSGEITIGDRKVAGQGLSIDPERRGVGMVFQEFALFPHLNVAQNVSFGLKSPNRHKRYHRVHEVLELVGLEGFETHYPHELSGGQQQRVALARAMAPRPSVILLDEPFSNLDADMRSQVAADVNRALRETKSTAILVTHDHEEAFTMADRIAVMNHGRMEQEGTPLDIYHLPVSRFVAEFVGPAVFIKGTVTHGGIKTRFGTVPNVPKLPEGEAVDLLFRPDDIELEPVHVGDAGVTGRKFRGSENIYTVQLDTGETVLSTQRSHALYEIGQRVMVHAELEHVVAFRK